MAIIKIKPHCSDNKYVIWLEIFINKVPKGLFQINTRLGEDLEIFTPELSDEEQRDTVVGIPKPIKEITWKTDFNRPQDKEEDL